MSKRRLNFLQRKMKWLEHDFQKMPAFLQAHSIMVANYAQCLFLLAQDVPDRRMPHAVQGFTPEEVAQMALYHDVGKVEIAQQIWTMPCRLAPEEYALMTAHTFFGARILLNTVLLPAARTQSGLEFRAAMADCCLCHHERWDGTGYPLGLAGESIPYLARLVAIADAYDAMTAGRPYQKAISRQQALQTISEGAGNQFDPILAGLFCGAQRNA